MDGPVDRETVIQEAIAYLNSHTLLTMATASLAGEPDATALEYVNDDLDVYVFCRPGSRKVEYIEQNPRVFYEIHDDNPITNDAIKSLKALQVAATGRVIRPGDPEFPRILDKMTSKFPLFSHVPRDSRYALHFTPKKLWYLDYGRKMFHREEISFPG
nr:pyridoxamine 5'-phosphate oxidase family protein [Candidatus Sigynarchaeota archaeon]